jgi:hypothetical protein
MICRRCKREIANGAMFCTQCGANQYEEPKTEGNSNSSVLLLIFIISEVVTGAFVQIVYKFVDNWWDSPWKIVCSCLWVVCNSLMILIPLAIKKQSLKIIGLVLFIPWILYLIYMNITNMFV